MTTTKQRIIIAKIKNLSDNYHKLSLLTYELSRSLEVKCDREKMTDKEFKEYVKDTHLEGKLKDFRDIL